MTDVYNGEKQSSGMAIKGLLISLVMNVGLPLLVIQILTSYWHTSEITALSIASIIPILNSVREVVSEHKLDLIAIFFLLGIITNIVAIVIGGNAQLLVIRESFFSGALGLVCFISLLLPRPLMFYTGRQMLAGKDPVKLAEFNAGWQNPYVRAVHRLITVVWGCALVGEFIVRVIIAYTLPLRVAFALGSTILAVTLAVTLAWTFAYIRYARKKGERLAQGAS
jgi:hypothetical protein